MAIDKTETAMGAIGAIVKLIELIAASLGKTTAQVLDEVAADCAKQAADPTDETDKAADEIRADLP